MKLPSENTEVLECLRRQSGLYSLGVEREQTREIQISDHLVQPVKQLEVGNGSADCKCVQAIRQSEQDYYIL